MEFLIEIWEDIKPLFNWGLFASIILLGYILSWLPAKWPKWFSNGWRVLIFGLILSVSWAFIDNLKATTVILTFFGSFGFHGAFLSRLEKIGKSIGGGGVSDPTKDSIGGGGVSDPTGNG